MAEQLKTINPDTVVTRVVKPEGTIMGRRMVSVGGLALGFEDHVFIGSENQIRTYAMISFNVADPGEIDLLAQERYRGQLNYRDLFHVSRNFLPDSFLQGLSFSRLLKTLGSEDLRALFENGGEFVEGPYAVYTRPGVKSRLDKERTGLWLPNSLAFPDGWRIVSEEARGTKLKLKPVPQSPNF